MVYLISRVFLKIVFKLFFRLKVLGAENVPAEGSLIFAANHSSYADPPLMGASVPRSLYFMAKKELFDAPAFGWFIKKLHAFPVDRGTVDFSALKNAIKILTEGNALLIFPEGTRKKKGAAKKLKNGAVMLSVTTGAPVIPVAIINSDRIFRLPKLVVVFGESVRFNDGDNLSAATESVMLKIEKMKRENAA